MPITNYSEYLMLIINRLKHRITNFYNEKNTLSPLSGYKKSVYFCAL